MTLLTRIYNYYRVKSAIKTANMFQKANNHQYYVIKIFNKIRVYDRNKINELIDAGILHKKLRDALELRKFCIYYTK